MDVRVVRRLCVSEADESSFAPFNAGSPVFLRTDMRQRFLIDTKNYAGGFIFFRSYRIACLHIHTNVNISKQGSTP
jgi:hypothetical protein